MNDTLILLSIVGLAALIHSSFQLGVSMLTLLSGHSLSIKRSEFRIFRLTSSFIFGSSVMTILLLSVFTLFLAHVGSPENHILIWTVLAGLLIGVGFAVWFTYYRSEPGTSLWIPRSLASFISDRTKKTRRSAESFSLGMSSVIGEILFLVAPLAASAYAIVNLPSDWQLIGFVVYAIVSMLSLLIVWTLVAFGYNLSQIQKWRETYKSFLQYSAAAGLIILGAFMYVNEAVGGMLV